jgi:hypothetical protein
VRARLKKLGITRKDLALKIGAAPSAVWDVITSPEAKSSSLVPAIHAAIGWDPPSEPQSPPQPSPEAIEMAALYDRLPEALRRKLRDDAELYLTMLDSKKR